ncbi:FapA family protein [Metallumcola ferriviriculae]|uniref:FapA family protein n=1 Tax=Metallumcola ferriviriculae TaxID=3039180 RepID=A0AAU0UK26_9FIRM|nr:FapA family protein [Desulfitibacteraceae bacterium MK1]
MSNDPKTLPNSNTDRPLRGTIGIKDGVASVIMPEPDAERPSLTPGDNVIINVNKREITDKTPINAEDEIEIKPGEKKASLDYTVQVDAALMHARMSVNYKYGQKFSINDSKPTQDLVVSAEFKEEVSPPALDYTTVIIELAQKGITHYINEGKIRTLLTSGQNCQRELIAEGVSPKPPMDESIEYVFQNKEFEEGRRLRRMAKILSVEAGEVLAVKHPGIPGEPGINLNGAPVGVRDPKAISIKTGKGVTLSPDGTKAYAAIDGRPDVVNGKLSVLPVCNHKGNVNPETGDISFKGDVIVSGNVEDNMLISATGEVTVTGFVANSTINSGGSITVNGNIVGCKLFAGKVSLICSSILNYLTKMEHQITLILKFVAQLHSQMQGKIPLDTAVRAIIKQKYPKLSQECAAFAADIRGKDEFKMMEGPVVQVVNQLTEAFDIVNNEKIYTDDMFTELQESITKAKDILDAMNRPDAALNGRYVQSSTLFASADIIINGEGCHQSILNAGRKVEIKGIKGLFKGGEINAGGNIYIKEAGSELGVATKIGTKAKQTIKMDIAWPGVEASTGTTRKVFYQKQHKIFLSNGA